MHYIFGQVKACIYNSLIFIKWAFWRQVNSQILCLGDTQSGHLLLTPAKGFFLCLKKMLFQKMPQDVSVLKIPSRQQEHPNGKLLKKI